MSFFFFQAEDGIRDLVRSRGLGDVYKRQGIQQLFEFIDQLCLLPVEQTDVIVKTPVGSVLVLSLIHI